MNDKALGGIVLVVIGVGALWLWYRGYFGKVINLASSALSGSSEKRGFLVGGQGTGLVGGLFGPKTPPSSGLKPKAI